MSINVVIIAAIALIVLVVLVYLLLFRGSKPLQQGLSECKGKCIPRGTPCNGPSWTSANCDDGVSQPIADGVCCVSV